MAEILELNQVTQIGVETTAGTSPTGGANKLLTGLQITFDPDFQVNDYAGTGRRFDSTEVPSEESSKIKIAGVPTFTELGYVMAGVWGAPTITTPSGATLARKWAYAPALTGAIPGKTLEIQRGDANLARQINYGQITDFGLDLTRKDGKVSGAGIGQQVQTGVALTATPTALALQAIQPKFWNVYADPTSANIGTTKLARCFHAKFDYTGGYDGIWPMDRSLASFAAVGDKKPKATLELETMADAQADTFFTAARAGSKYYVRLEAIGAQIETGTPNQFYTLVIDMCVGIQPDAYGANGVAFTQMQKFTILEDPAWTEGGASGTGISAYLINTLTSL